MKRLIGNKEVRNEAARNEAVRNEEVRNEEARNKAVAALALGAASAKEQVARMPLRPLHTLTQTHTHVPSETPRPQCDPFELRCPVPSLQPVGNRPQAGKRNREAESES